MNLTAKVLSCARLHTLFLPQGLLGYDITNSDPSAEGGDPAYRGKIFNAVEMDKDGRMSMDGG